MTEDGSPSVQRNLFDPKSEEIHDPEYVPGRLTSVLCLPLDSGDSGSHIAFTGCLKGVR